MFVEMTSMKRNITKIIELKVEMSMSIIIIIRLSIWHLLAQATVLVKYVLHPTKMIMRN